MKTLVSFVIPLFLVLSCLFAFDKESLEQGLVKRVDLPAGHSVLVPAFFEVENQTEGSVTFSDPEGSHFCTAMLLPVEPEALNDALEGVIIAQKEQIPDVEHGETTIESYTVGRSKEAFFLHLPVTAPLTVGFYHLLVQTEDKILYISVSAPGDDPEKYPDMERKIARLILLSLRDSAARELKRAEGKDREVVI